jgi:hypothetical protein
MLKNKIKKFTCFFNFPSQFFFNLLVKNSTYHKKYIINVKLVMVSLVYINVGWVFDLSNIDWLLVSSI